jgi:hypothetical protein
MQGNTSYRFLADGNYLGHNIGSGDGSTTSGYRFILLDGRRACMALRLSACILIFCSYSGPRQAFSKFSLSRRVKVFELFQKQKQQWQETVVYLLEIFWPPSSPRERRHPVPREKKKYDLLKKKKHQKTKNKVQSQNKQEHN